MFDGPVDAIWIENMNTVLDDNKKLCLNSGEMLQMSDTMSMIFEVDDLSVASPATVSRCGMVYMEPGSLGFEPLVVSWLDAMPPYVLDNTSCARTLRALMDAYVLDCITFVKRFCTEPVLTTTNNLVQSLMRLIDTYLYPFRRSPTNHMDEEGPSAESLASLERNIEQIFLFSVVWSIGGCIDNASRFKFSNFLRHLMDDRQSNVCFPPQGVVYDYCVEEPKTNEERGTTHCSRHYSYHHS